MRLGRRRVVMSEWMTWVELPEPLLIRVERIGRKVGLDRSAAVEHFLEEGIRELEEEHHKKRAEEIRAQSGEPPGPGWTRLNDD